MVAPAPAIVAYLHYRGKGIARRPAAAMAAVLWTENKLPGPVQKALRTYALQMDRNPDTLECQLDFVLTECANDYPGVWQAIHNDNFMLSAFLTMFTRQYENPHDPEGVASKAYPIAQAILSAYPPDPDP